MQLRRKSGVHSDRSYKVYSQMGWGMFQGLDDSATGGKEWSKNVWKSTTEDE